MGIAKVSNDCGGSMFEGATSYCAPVGFTAPTPILRTASASPLAHPRFAAFVSAFTDLADVSPCEDAILAPGAVLLSRLLEQDDWLAPEYALAGPEGYRQHLLHLDGRGRFSVVVGARSPGQVSPIHDHGVWGLIGVLRGIEFSQSFTWGYEAFTTSGLSRRLTPGDIDLVSVSRGDVHQVRNPSKDQTAVTIQVYGGDFGLVERHMYDRDGEHLRFASGYDEAPPSG